MPKKSCFLVPYDIDSNQYPGKKNGHQAHWAIVIGIVVICSDQIKNETQSEDQIQIHTKLSIDVIEEYAKEFYLVVRQSKSLRLFLYSPKIFIESNCNLIEFNDKKRNRDEFVLPEGGVSQGLNGKFVSIKIK